MSSWHRSCIDCGKNFVFTQRECQTFRARGFVEPKRCKECRKGNREAIGIQALQQQKFDSAPSSGNKPRVEPKWMIQQRQARLNEKLKKKGNKRNSEEKNEDTEVIIVENVASDNTNSSTTQSTDSNKTISSSTHLFPSIWPQSKMKTESKLIQVVPTFVVKRKRKDGQNDGETEDYYADDSKKPKKVDITCDQYQNQTDAGESVAESKVNATNEGGILGLVDYDSEG